MKRYLAPFISLAIMAAIVAAPAETFAAATNKVAITSSKVAINKIAIRKHRHHRRSRTRRHVAIRRHRK